MAEPLNDLVQQWVTADTDGRAVLVPAMLAVAQPLAVRAAKGKGLTAADAADVAQHACRELVSFLESGKTFKRSADAYVWRIAENRAVDVQRKNKRDLVHNERLLQEAKVAPSTPDPLAELLQHERVEHLRSRLRAVLEQAPPNYRTVLERHYLGEELIEEIAEDYFREMVASGNVDLQNPADVAAKHLTARRRVDTHLMRAREWMRCRLEIEETN